MDIQKKQQPAENDIPRTKFGEGMQNSRMNPRMRNQVLATVIANMSTLTVGTMLMAAIQYGKIGDGQDTRVLIFSFAAIILGLLISYFSCECYGRKMTICMSAMFLITSCGMIAIDIKPAYATIAFFFQLFGSSMYLFTLPIYVSEISCDRIRGTLGSMRMIFMIVGFAVAHLLHCYCEIHTTAIIVIFFPLMLIVGMQWMPESPVFLVRKSQLRNATRSLMWLRNNDEEWVQNELLSIMQTVKRMSKSGSCIDYEFGRGVNGLFASSAKRRCFLVASGLLAAQSLCEVPSLAGYKSLHLRPDHNGTTLSILITFYVFSSPILGSILATLLMDTVGRRRLLLISFIGMLLVTTVNLIDQHSLFGEYSSGHQWSSDALGFAWSISYYLGLGTVPFVIAVEVFEREVLSFGYMMCLVISWSVTFIFIWIRPMLYMFVSFPVNPAAIALIIFYVCCFVFTYGLVPETKGKAIE